MKRFFGLLSLLTALSTGIYAQTGEVKNDTIYVVSDVNHPVEFSKAIGKYLYIKDIIPADIPVKSRTIEIISSVSTKIDIKQIQIVDNKHMIIPIELFTQKYYTLYIKKSGATILNKKIIIR